MWEPACSPTHKRKWFVQHTKNWLYYATRRGVTVHFANYAVAKKRADALNREHPCPKAKHCHWNPAMEI